MQLDELIQKGDLKEALQLVQSEVRKNPAEAKHRVGLFQLLCILGHWDKALTQLNVAAELDSNNLLMAQVCREALQCEALRAEIFSGKKSPLIFGEPEEWVVWLIKANELSTAKEFKAAQELRQRAFESAPTVEGVIDDQKFNWIADADSRLGPILEAVIDGRYYWVPMKNIRIIKIESPSDLRDLVWTPVNFIWKNGGNSVGLIPTRYPGSELSEDCGIQLARKTEWLEKDGGLFIGLGQRMFATNQNEYPLLEARQIDFHHQESASK